MDFSDAEWKDVQPIYVEDASNAVCSIAYPKEYKDAMAYFRAILEKNELNERALGLTEEILAWNPGHYSVWHYRRRCLTELETSLHEELEYVRQMAQENPKNYQIWYHRQVLIEELQDSSAELTFINEALANDAKNYHAWSYRQWLVKRFNLWDGELQDMDRLIKEDIRNNSAWNHRFFVLTQGPLQGSVEACQQEVLYSLEKLKLAPSNSSAWNYLKGLSNLHPNIAAHDQVLTWARQSEEKGSTSVPLLAYVARHDKEKARDIYTKLATQLDPIRRNWWNSLIAN